jgi:hypothetical protein
MLNKLLFLSLVVGWLGSHSVRAQSYQLVVPVDSAVVSYFPAQASQLHSPAAPSDTSAQAMCRYAFRYASQCLAAFKAPVLAGNYLGPVVYRFVWLRSFHRPVLLTLERTENGGTLKTQFMNKQPGMAVPTLLDPDEPGITSEVRKNRLKFAQQMAADKKWRASVAFAKSPAVVTAESTVALSAVQVQALDQLLGQANFWQLPGCDNSTTMDGAYWILEASEPARYHVVFRHSPGKQEQFRQCCDFLLNLSPARKERRY